MILTHNPKSGVIKRDGAVVGVITKAGRSFVFDHYTFKKGKQLSAATVAALLPKIRKQLDEN